MSIQQELFWTALLTRIRLFRPRQGGTFASVCAKPICPILDILILGARTREKVGYRESGREARQKVKETGDFVHFFENSKSFPDKD